MRKYTVILILFILSANLISQDIDAYILRSAASLEAGEPGRAREICIEALSREKDYRLYLLLGRAQHKMGLYDEAISSYTAANSLNPGSGELGLAYIYAGALDAGRAVYHLERHLGSPYRVPESSILLDESFVPLQSTRQWKELWKRSWYTALERGLAEAEYLIANNRLDELKKLESKLQPLYRDEPEMIYLTAMVKAAEGDREGALAYYREAESMAYVTPSFYDSYLEILLESRKYIEAVRVGESALKQHPDRSDYLLLLAEARRGSGDRERAAREVILYLDLFPGSEKGLALAGKISSELSNYSDALKYFSKSVELYPGKPEHYISRGDVYSRTKTWQYAISDYSMALDLQPGDGDVYYSKGMALLKTGKRDDACRDFRMALKYGNKKAAAQINKNCIR